MGPWNLLLLFEVSTLKPLDFLTSVWNPIICAVVIDPTVEAPYLTHLFQVLEYWPVPLTSGCLRLSGTYNLNQYLELTTLDQDLKFQNPDSYLGPLDSGPVSEAPNPDSCLGPPLRSRYTRPRWKTFPSLPLSLVLWLAETAGEARIAQVTGKWREKREEVWGTTDERLV